MPPAVTADRWFPAAGNEPVRDLALFCLPYAGGSTSAFRGWSGELGGVADVFPAQLPGRESRITESPHIDVGELTDALVRAVLRRGGRPYALYGHSMGGRLSFEVIRNLRGRGLPLPVGLFVGGARSPHLDVPIRRVAGLPDDEFCDHLVAMGGTPPGVLDEPELRALLLPVLRADFTLVESYTYQPADPVPVPIVAFAGRDDPEAGGCDMVGWSAHTSARFELHTLPGDHFFLNSARGELLGMIADRLAEPGRHRDPAPPADDEVCVIEARLDELPELCAATGELSRAEAERAAACGSPVDAARLVGRRVLLRRTLTAMGVEVGTGELPRGPHGKPAAPHHSGLRFNTAHSAGVALVAVSRGRELGVDVERARPVAGPAGVAPDGSAAARTGDDADRDPIPGPLDDAERAVLAGLTGRQARAAALLVRTAKQAVGKASGDRLEVRGGLSFAAALADRITGPPGARSWRPEPTGAGRLSGWRVRHLDVAGAVAAVAAGSDDWRLRYLTVRKGAP